MKTLLLIIALVLGGCVRPEIKQAERTNFEYDVYIDTLRGHEYIIYDGYKSGGIIHAEHCQCKGGK